MNTNTDNLKRRTIKAGRLVLIGHVFSQGLRFGSNLVLTRLLAPEMFGMLAVVNVILVGLSMFSDLGLLQNIVKSKRGEDPDYLNTAWTIQIIRGFSILLVNLTICSVFYLLGVYGLLPKNTVYNDTQFPLILALMSISSVIAGFNSIQLPLLNRKLMVGKQVTIDLLSQSLGLTFMIYWAYHTHSIWALVYGSLTTVTLKMLFSHIFNLGNRCRFCWDKSAVKEIIHFGKWIFFSSILSFLLMQSDKFLLGGLVTPEMLGIYTVAFFLATAVNDMFTKLINAVFLPVLGEVYRNNPSNLKKIFYTVKFKIDAIAMSTAGVLFVLGSQIIEILYDDRYKEAGWMLETLSLSLLATSTVLMNQLFIAIGKPHYNVKLSVLQLILYYTLLPLVFYLYGFYATVIVIALQGYVRIFFGSFFLHRTGMLSLKREVIVYPFFFVGFMIGKLIISMENYWGIYNG